MVIEKFAANLLGSLLSGLVALLIFYLGNRGQSKRAIEEKEKNLKQTLNHFVNSIESEISQIQISIDNYNKYIKNVSEFPYNEHYLTFTPSYNIERIKTIDPNEIRQALNLKFRNNKSEINVIYNDLYQCIDYLHAERNMTQKQLENVMNAINNIREKTQFEFVSLTDYISLIISSKEKANEIKDKDFLKSVSTIANEYYININQLNKLDIAIDYHYTNFLFPLRDKLVETKSPLSNERIKVLESIRRLAYMKTEIENRSIEHARIIENTNKDLTKMFKLLEKNIRLLK